MINSIKSTTSKAKPPAKPQPSPQLPPYPIIIVPTLDKRIKLGFILRMLMGLLYLMFLRMN